MATPKQKADVRPISFVLHNTAAGGGTPTKIDLVIRPEDLTRPEPSRTVIHQTLGGAWLDSWGAGLPTVQISGTTGWGAGGRKDGLQEFQRLHETVFKRWHDEREAAIVRGFDPDKVKLIFADELDEFTWVVAPLNFVLRRNKARPLLSQYQISLGWIADGVIEKSAVDGELASLGDVMGVAKSQSQLERIRDTLANSLAKIQDFAASLKGSIGAVLGPIQQAVASFTALTATVLSYVNDVIATGMSVIQAVSNPLIEIAGNLSRAAANVVNAVSSVLSIPQRIKAEFSRVVSAFVNVFCVLSNGLGKRKFLPNYDDLYGASVCSSTAGGRPLSRYDTQNPFPELLPVQSGPVTVTGNAQASLARLMALDVTDRATTTTEQLQAEMISVTTGVLIV